MASMTSRTLSGAVLRTATLKTRPVISEDDIAEPGDDADARSAERVLPNYPQEDAVGRARYRRCVQGETLTTTVRGAVMDHSDRGTIATKIECGSPTDVFPGQFICMDDDDDRPTPMRNGTRYSAQAKDAAAVRDHFAQVQRQEEEEYHHDDCGAREIKLPRAIGMLAGRRCHCRRVVKRWRTVKTWRELPPANCMAVESVFGCNCFETEIGIICPDHFNRIVERDPVLVSGLRHH